MFEDAFLSGVLTLKNRKLKEFPSGLCIKYDISDLVAADLSGNRLTEMPACMCELDSLETLQIKDNCLKQLPSSLHMLKSLTYLDLSGNRLTNIPPALCSLKLKVLLLAGNKLEMVPREIRQMDDTLQELDLSYNRIRVLPTDITLLKALRVLNLRSNMLTDLPSELGQLQLRILDISANRLTCLPTDLRNLTACTDFRANDNPLVAPPVSVVVKGRDHIFKWLRVQAMTDNNNSRYPDWNRFASTNATLRRTDRANLERNMDRAQEKKVERRSRSTRFNTVGGSDSGYASTGDEQRFSHEFGISKGSLEDISEKIDYSPTDLQNPQGYTGDLAKEVMMAYAETILEKKMAARGAPLSPTSTTTALFSRSLDVTNNNFARSPKAKDMSQKPPLHRDRDLEHDRLASQPKTAVVKPLQAPPRPPKGLPKPNEDYAVLSPVLENPASPSKPMDSEVDLTKNFAIQSSTQAEAQIVIKPKEVIRPQTEAKNIREASEIIKQLNPSPPSSIDKKPMGRAPKATISSLSSSQSSLASTKTISSNPRASNLKKPSPTAKVSPTNVNGAAGAGLKKPEIRRSKESMLPKKSISPRGSPPNSSHGPTTQRSSIPAKTSPRAPSSITPPKAQPFTKSMSADFEPPPVSSKTSTTSDTSSQDSGILPDSPTGPSNGPNGPNGPMSKSMTSSKITGLTRSPSANGSMIDTMRKILEQKLGSSLKLPQEREKLAAALANGVHLCNYVNQIRIRAVPTVLTPISNTNTLCSINDILDKKNLQQTARAVIALNKVASEKPTSSTAPKEPTPAPTSNIPTSTMATPSLSRKLIASNV